MSISLEVEKSRSGDIILKYDRRYSCSKISPKNEAQKWIEKNNKSFSFASDIYVIGIGSGYHIEALSTSFPSKKIIVFEQLKGAVKFFKKEFPFLSSQIEIVYESSSDSIKKRIIQQKLFANHYSLVRFYPAFSANTEINMEIEDFLLARTHEGFSAAIQQIEGLQALAKEYKNSLKDISEPISIVELNKKKSLSGSNQQIFKILGELIR